MAKIPKQTKKLKFDLSEVPRGERKAVREKIGKTLVKEILDFTRKGKSPVEGESFERLSKSYADKKKGGNRKPNLRLSRDMTNAIDYKIKGSTIEVGIFDSDEKGKADGHNNFSGLSRLPQRRFIPGEDQDFKKPVNDKINTIIANREKAKPKKTEFREGKEAKAKTISSLNRSEEDKSGTVTVFSGIQIQNLDDFIINTILRLGDE